ncbi:hypothetical protein [Methanobacterium spitsbergense]|uniref:PsbP C-terminal domain-containing protein n=1 Tax=Methanobacterium spitsbergense TaxID=2874285 RepID=A0A8T5V582_9EURY|nr:hypothetical protein [Methanobacterium spitsbergense]MBZ2166825.1 hypothetical protein [Methanobacterium spitsbergense]
MIIKCKKCGNEYELGYNENLSDYQCECGGELSLNKRASEPVKTLKTQKKSDIIEDLNEKGKNRKIWIARACSIALILTTVFGVMIFPDNTTSGNSTTNISKNPTNIPNNTYSGNGLTFNYPADWKQISNLYSPSRWGYPNPFLAYYEQNGNNGEKYIETYFYIKQRDVGSLAEMLKIYRSDIASISQTEVSERNITVNGMKAVELIKTWRTGNKQYKALTVHIEVIPGSKYYRIGCVVPASEYNATLPKFEMVVNSFRPLNLR